VFSPDNAMSKFVSEDDIRPPAKNCGHRRGLFFAFSKLAQGVAWGSYAFFDLRPQAEICFCF
jgi:hypothetical protein